MQAVASALAPEQPAAALRRRWSFTTVELLWLTTARGYSFWRVQLSLPKQIISQDTTAKSRFCGLQALPMGKDRSGAPLSQGLLKSSSLTTLRTVFVCPFGHLLHSFLPTGTSLNYDAASPMALHLPALLTQEPDL